MRQLFNLARAAFRNFRSSRFVYDSLVEIHLKREALLNNYSYYKNKFPALHIAPVLKSNAYGHGLLKVAQVLEKANPAFFCVDSFFEALVLRNENIDTPLLIIGYTPIENILKSKLKDISFSILSLAELRRLAQKLNRPTTFHLKIDTGMHRHGISLVDIEEAISLIRSNANIRLEGIYTHLADADIKDSEHVRRQIKLWNSASRHLRDEFASLIYAHCAATAGTNYAQDIEANTMRVGLGIYGIELGQHNPSLKPALELTTKITSLRTIEAGETIGYNATFTAHAGMRVATIPVGYTEGLDRRLSNIGVVTVRGHQCPIVGRVSMNISSIDVSAFPDIELEDEVVVISADPMAPNSIENLARLCETVPYVILVHIPEHLRRKLI